MLKLSLITPSLNQAKFLPQTLKSIESQSVAPSEHIIFDAGSTDGTLEMLRAYEQNHAYATLHIGRDRSQTHAINMGFSECSGDVIGWLNTDDHFTTPSVIQRVLKTFEANPEVDVVYGRGRFIDAAGHFLRDSFINSDAGALPELLPMSVGILQPATFMRRSLFERVGELNGNLHYCMDYEYWIRIAKAGGKFLFLDENLCDAILHTDSKTMGQRATSLRETVEMVRAQYGFAPVEWLERLADAELYGSDGILKVSDKSDALDQKTRELFVSFNSNKCNVRSMFDAADIKGAQKSIEMLRTAPRVTDAFIVTAFDSAFFRSGLTQLAHLQKHASCQYEVFIFDLGLTEAEINALETFENVLVLGLPVDDRTYFDGYFSGQTYGFKSYAAHQVSRLIPDHSTILWMDAGIAPIRNMQKIWDTISTLDALFVDHDDKSAWPFFNVNFTSPACIKAMGASNAELLAPHIRAGLFGFKSGGRYQAMIDSAFQYSLDHNALAGDKHPERSNSQNTQHAAEIRSKAQTDADFQAKIPFTDLQDAFGYYGHRHDQTILSILAHRFQAPIQSAEEFCIADSASSNSSKTNWTNGHGAIAQSASDKVASYYLSKPAICMQHRGTYFCHEFTNSNANAAIAKILLGKSAQQESSGAISSDRMTVQSDAPASSATKESDRMSVSAEPTKGTAYVASNESALKRELQTLPADPRRTVLNPPSISIVTPNYNTAGFIERTMKSVIDQGYPNLEYVVVDGNSTDGSQDIISKYRNSISGYISEPDEGHSDALNKGFAMTSGDIMGWINSDDLLLPGSLAAIGEFFAKHPEVEWVTGQPTVVEEDGTWKLHNLRKWSRVRFLNGNYRWIQQESTFWRRSLWERAGGGLSRDIDLAVDFELWVRFFRHAELYTYQLPLGTFRYREGQRSTAFRERYEAEALSVIQKEAENLDPDYKNTFQAMFPETIHPLEYLEVGARERELSICDTPTISVDEVSKLPEVPFKGPAPKSKRHDTAERLLACDDLTKFRGLHSGKRCFVMGNGPSLNEMDLNKLEGEYVFGCNSIFLLFDRIKWRPTFYTCVDSRVLPDRAKDIDEMLAGLPSTLAFFPNEVVEHSGDERRFPTRTIIPPAKGRHYFKERPNSLQHPPYSMFSADINDHIVQPYTVAITMLQIAAYMGFSEIYLIGCDTSYTVPEDAIKEGVKADGEIGLALTSTADTDPNHFDPSYFGAGRKWHDPQPHMMIEHHRHARDACEKLGVKVYNATVGGKLEVYVRRDFDSLFESAPKPAVAPPAAKAAIRDSAILKEAQSTRGASLDETEIVADMLSSRRGNTHVLLDVGAHIGTSAQYFDRLGWTIHCFEPDPKNRAQLSSRFGSSSNVSIDPRAVSDKPTKGMKFFTSDESTGISGLHAFRDTHKATTTVDATTVTEIVKTRKLEKVDFLKIDVEGFDYSVLRGVPWDTLKPDVVECEFEDSKTLPLGHDWRHVANYLKDRGYAVYVSEWHPIIRYGISHDWRRVVPFEGCEMSSDSWGNLLAFQEDPGLEAVQSAFEARLKFQKNSAETQTIVKKPPITIPVKGPQSTISNGKVDMLQKTPGYTVEQIVSPGRMWYSKPAHKLRSVSPLLFELVRFARRSIVHIATSRILFASLIAIAGLVAWFSLDARFADIRPWLLGGTALGIVTLALAYVAARAQAHAAALHIEAHDLKVEMIRLKEQVNSSQHSNLIDQKLAYRDAQIGNVRSALQIATKELNKLKKSVSVEEFDAKFQSAASSLDTKLQTTTSQIASKLNSTTADLEAIYQTANATMATIANDVAAISGSLGTVTEKLAQVDSVLTRKVNEAKAAIEDVSTRTQTAETAASKAAGDVNALSDKVSMVDSKLAATDKWSRFDNATWFQHFNRRLSKHHIHTLETEWRKRLSIPIAPATLGYMADRACEIERQLDGRLATSIEDILLRTLVAAAVRGKTVDVLEIGTLFATGAAIMFDTLDGRYEDVHFTLLDPLEGYYNGAQADILTGQRVDEHVVRKNLARVGMREDQYTLIKHLSTEPEAMTEAGKKEYDVLVIDGDHSYAGVKTDFENYADFVRVGGYIIFDDYASEDWPDVAEFVDSELADVEHIARVGASWRTCVYRVVKKPASQHVPMPVSTPKPRSRKLANSAVSVAEEES
ncbi:FkbM family methyltransferase [Hyphomonas sp. UBA5107]|jgi:FkbM family methyltransferase|uniref:FkbM family methyltransferase n=1 Tax=Hyphomonas sp. UBA5107 TaxID=1946636 RepID=UPI000C497DEA|nr:MULTISPECIES: FkbM family methyltransferase [unclassified Hyphomonas]MAA82197.1 hypothetical protein [Hyphomonas sp.]HCN91965.1 hypothetical protein [Hyphomonas sp.]|tara:strand:+ start:15563 stop:22009 length:6447 start_codon:yes stop_codon:yes gene_type:complete